MSAAETYEVVVVGGGKGGKTLAIDLGKHGVRTALIERDPQMVGGGCINLACIPTKTFVQSAKVLHTAQHAAEYGIVVDGARADWLAVRKRVEDVVTFLRAVHLKQFTTTPGLDFILGSARFLDRQTVEVTTPEGTTRRLTAPKIFINTGTRPAEAAIPGLAEVGAHNSNTIQRLDALPAQLIVIGGGYIALEFAQLFRRLGSQVTVVVRGPQILPREDDDVAAAVAKVLMAEGITIISEATPLRAEKGSAGLQLVVQTKRGEQAIPGSHLLVAIGRTPNTECLGCDAAGVELDRRGYVRVNERLETSAPGVWALGDCNGGPQFTHASLDDYRIVKANVFGRGGRTATDRLIPSTLFIEPELAQVGLTEKDARAKGIEFKVARIDAAVIPRARTSGHVTGLLKVLIDPASGKILGCTIFAAEAGEMLSTMQMAMIAGLPYTAVRDAVLSHPTMTEGLYNLLSTL